MKPDQQSVRALILFWKAQGLAQAEVGERIANMDLNGYREDACEFVHEAFEGNLLPEVVITNRPLRDVSAHALEVLYGCNGDTDGIYRRASTLVRIVKDDEGRPIIEPVSESAFRGRLERTCAFHATGKKGQLVPIAPPMEVVRDCMSLGDWQFPALMGITETPVLRSDGTVFASPGYDTKTRLYYPHGSMTIEPIPDEPSDLDVGAAITLLFEPICDFPFDSNASKANALAALMTPVIRPMIDSPVPLTIIDKPQAGTGASLMAELISIIATGRPAAMMTAQNDDDSWRKAITSLLWRGQQVAVIDNIEHTLWAPSLAAVLTSTTFQDRVLGRTEMIQLPNRVTWVGTGNNIKLAGDLPRRTVWVRLDAHQARPWLRDAQGFRHPNLIEWVTQNRADIIRAILVIARAWVVSGKQPPTATTILGGYESWCRVLGGILEFIQVPEFLANLEELYAQADTETPQWEAFLEAWCESLGPEPITVASLISYINDNAEFSSCLPDAIGDRGEKGFSRKLGKQLAKREGVHYPNGCCLVKGIDSHRKVAAWSVVRGFGDSETANPADFVRNAGFAGFSSTQADAGKHDLFSQRFGAETNPADPANPADSDDLVPDFGFDEEASQ